MNNPPRLRAKTQALIDDAVAVLTALRPMAMTLRQLYYQLVAREIIENNMGQYKRLSKAIVAARQSGAIPWDWIEDRTRKPRPVPMWNDLADFGETVIGAYKRDVWSTQPRYIESWLEKDAISGIFADVLQKYGVTLNVGRGFDGWSSIKGAADRFGDGSETTVLYYGDFDPSGEDMVRSLRARLKYFGCDPEIVKCALTLDQIHEHELPPAIPKTSDTRTPAFVEKYGDVSVELDSLPVDVLKAGLVREVESRMDLDALEAVREQEERDREKLVGALEI